MTYKNQNLIRNFLLKEEADKYQKDYVDPEEQDKQNDNDNIQDDNDVQDSNNNQDDNTEDQPKENPDTIEEE